MTKLEQAAEKYAGSRTISASDTYELIKAVHLDASQAALAIFEEWIEGTNHEAFSGTGRCFLCGASMRQELRRKIGEMKSK